MARKSRFPSNRRTNYSTMHQQLCEAHKIYDKLHSINTTVWSLAASGEDKREEISLHEAEEKMLLEQCAEMLTKVALGLASHIGHIEMNEQNNEY